MVEETENRRFLAGYGTPAVELINKAWHDGELSATGLVNGEQHPRPLTPNEIAGCVIMTERYMPSDQEALPQGEQRSEERVVLRKLGAERVKVDPPFIDHVEFAMKPVEDWWARMGLAGSRAAPTKTPPSEVPRIGRPPNTAAWNFVDAETEQMQKKPSGLSTHARAKAVQEKLSKYCDSPKGAGVRKLSVPAIEEHWREMGVKFNPKPRPRCGK
jgi:hypothetical protein